MHVKPCALVGTIDSRIRIVTQTLQCRIDGVEAPLNFQNISGIGVMQKVVKPNNMATMLASGRVVIFAAKFEENLATYEIVAEHMKQVLDLEGRAYRKSVAGRRGTIALKDEPVLEISTMATLRTQPLTHFVRGECNLLRCQDDVSVWAWMFQ